MWDVLSFSRIGNARRRKQEEIKDVHRCPPLRGDIIWAHVTDFLLAFSVSYFECYCSVVQTQSMADPLLICLENSHVHIQKQVCDCVCARWRRTTARENQSAQNSHTFTLLTHTSSHTHTHTARSHTHTRHHTHTHTVRSQEMNNNRWSGAAHTLKWSVLYTVLFLWAGSHYRIFYHWLVNTIDQCWCDTSCSSAPQSDVASRNKGCIDLSHVGLLGHEVLALCLWCHTGNQGSVLNWLPPPMKISGADTASRYLSCQVCWFHIRTHTFTAQQSDRHKAEPEDPGDGLQMADSQTWPIWTGDAVFTRE